MESIQGLKETNKPEVFGANNARQKRKFRQDGGIQHKGEEGAGAAQNDHGAVLNTGDEDTVIVTNAGGGSFGAALKSAGAACQAIDLLLQARAVNAFCCVRPPGHHAGESRYAFYCKLFADALVWCRAKWSTGSRSWRRDGYWSGLLFVEQCSHCCTLRTAAAA
jgi:hypothetical protein